MEEKKINVWKIIAISLLFVLIFSLVIIGYLYHEGVKITRKEELCAKQICINEEFYYYDYISDYCSCYIGDKLITNTDMQVYYQAYK